MDISRVNNAGFTPPGQLVSAAAHARNAERKAEKQETVSLGQQQQEDLALTYSKPPASRGNTESQETQETQETQSTQGPQDLAALLEESDRKASEMLQLLGNLIQKQGLEWSKVASGEQQLSADPETIKAAQAAIGEDGEFGVRKTAERILSFARSMIGDDPSRLEAVRNAVTQGFDEAREMLGGTLPDISEQTYDTIMAEFDRWGQDGLPANGSIALPSQSSAQAAA
ncbi:DUF5610 domain-containing protein [Vogesella amnigena]|uniref:DUF5610 domain-containing protein n=1 Tax=Vogesella amnigena TaxID=1507449 RepID=A0ABV7TRK7_9NEIS